MEIPPNILKELEERKAQALLEKAAKEEAEKKEIIIEDKQSVMAQIIAQKPAQSPRAYLAAAGKFMKDGFDKLTTGGLLSLRARYQRYQEKIKKARATLSQVAAPEKLEWAAKGETPRYGSGQGGEKGERGIEIPIFPISPIPPLLLEAEPHKPTGGEMFFAWLSKIAVLAAVLTVPLFFFNSSDTINLPKQFLLSALALAAVIGWVGKTITSGRVVWRKTVLIWPAAVVALAAVFSSALSSSFWVSFLGDAGRYSSSGLTVLSYLIIFTAAAQIFGRRDFLVAAALWLVSTFLVSLYALLQFFGLHVFGGAYGARLFNTIGGPFSLGLFALSPVPFILAALQSKANPWKFQGLALVVLVVMLAVQIFVAAAVDFRVGWTALAVGALALIVISLRRGGGEAILGYRKKVLLPLAVVALAVILWFVRGPQIKDLVLPAEINPSYGASMDILKNALAEKPIFGSGLETYPYVYAKFKSAVLNQTNFWGVNFNDSIAEAVTWVTTAGLFGAAALASFIIVFLVYAFRRPDPSTMLGASPSTLVRASGDDFSAGLLASWIFILFSKFFYPTSLALEFFFWFLPALFVLCDTNTRMHANDTNGLWSYRFQPGSVKTLAVFFGLLAVLVAALAGEYFSIRRWGAERTFIKAVMLPDAPEKRDEKIAAVNAAIAANPYEVRYSRVFAQVLFQKMGDVISGINARPPETRRAKPEEGVLLQNLTVGTISAVRRVGALDPQNVGAAVDVAEAYRNLVPLVQGADDLAIQIYEKAGELEPINPFIKTQLGQLYLVKSNLLNQQGLEADAEFADKARSVLEEALKLNPNYANARFFYALIQDSDGDKDAALRNFTVLSQTNPDNQLLIQIVANIERDLPALGVPPAPATPPNPPKAKETKGIPK